MRHQTPQNASPVQFPESAEQYGVLRQRAPILPLRRCADGFRRLLPALALILTSAMPAIAAPAAPATQAQCPIGNLLAGRSPMQGTYGVTRSRQLTDGRRLSAGAYWELRETGIISRSGKVIWDLGRLTTLRDFYIQADNNDTYLLEGSTDLKGFSPLWEAQPVKSSGLQERNLRLERPSQPVRYLRLSARGGDGRFSVSELQVFCQKIATWPPPMRRVRGHSLSTSDIRKHFIGRAKIGVALFALLLFFSTQFAQRRKKTQQDDEDDGEWEAPMITNPDYKGEWKAKRIDNPEYKGEWKAKQIDNENYDEELVTWEELQYVGFELWTVNNGSIFDNIYVGDSLDEAKELAADTWFKFKDDEKAAKDKYDEAKKAEEASNDDDDEDDEDDEDEEDEEEEEKGEL